MASLRRGLTVLFILALLAFMALFPRFGHAQSLAEDWAMLRGAHAAAQASVVRFKAPLKRLSIARLVTASARRHGLAPALAHAIVRIESGYRCNARSWAGAVGIMQTLPATAAAMGIAGRLTDCATGLEAGMRYLSRIVRAHGVSCASLSLYERGDGARPRCTAYGRRAMALMRG
jgi:soluble lytic murein transglycosylase-like protein